MKPEKIDPQLNPEKTETYPETQMFRGGQILRAPVDAGTPTTVAELVTVLRTLGLLK